MTRPGAESPPLASAGDRANIVHRELLQLLALVAIAVAAFVGTRAVAANNVAMNARDAAEWFARGETQLASGRVDEAISSLRRATAKAPGEQKYVVALAHALALGGRDAEAWAALLTLRESVPDDIEVNLQLARLAGARDDVTEASRYYHNALYSPWATDQSEARRAVRRELITFLLQQHQNSRALSELLVLASDLPDTPGDQIGVARLFTAAGDRRRALDHYAAALRADPRNEQALAGAGEAAFELGDYTSARRYLRRLPPHHPGIARVRSTVELVITDDPLAPRTAASERRARMLAALAYARRRLSDCITIGSASGSADGDQPMAALQEEAMALQQRLRPTDRIDQDILERGLNLVWRIERTVARRCPPTTPMDDALLLIARAHGAEQS
jgi:tetratricopeptide (TPR) repeat protein